MSVVPFEAGVIHATARQALQRLAEGADPIIGRATRIAILCADKGEIGLLAPDDYPAEGRVVVPASVLKDLALIATSRMIKP